MKRITNVCIIALTISSMSLHGQKSGSTTFFQESAILNPFLSEIRSTVIKTEFALINKLDKNYYLSDYTKRPFIETHLGVGVPFVNYLSSDSKLKISVSGEIGNILLIDMFEEITAPVINTDYFFGLKIGAVKYLDKGNIKNIGVKIVPLFHESTHIGDEFAIHGFADIPDFKRVNISYEAWELAVVLNDPDTLRSNLLSAKAGVQGLWGRSEGFYVTDTLETKGVMVPPGKKYMEYYLQLNMQRTEGFLCSDRWMNVLSLEARNRVKFSYDFAVPEERSWNYNIYFGWKYLTKGSKRNVGFFIRHYSGIIPNGQFRDTDGYKFWGFSVVYH